MKTLKQICKGLKSALKLSISFLLLRSDGPRTSQGRAPCVGRCCVPQRTAKADASTNCDHHSLLDGQKRGRYHLPGKSVDFTQSHYTLIVTVPDGETRRSAERETHHPERYQPHPSSKRTCLVLPPGIIRLWHKRAGRSFDLQAADHIAAAVWQQCYRQQGAPESFQ